MTPAPDDLMSRIAKGEPLHEALRAAVEVEQTSYLWVPADEITFVPRLLDTIYGDGRALFSMTTINNRPAYWLVRGDSGWSCDDSRASDDAPDFGDFTDDILTDLEDQFGRARCGYSGANLYLPPEDRGCDCEECLEEPPAEWPMVDENGGCSWSRRSWPALDGVTFEPHPFGRSANVPTIG